MSSRWMNDSPVPVANHNGHGFPHMADATVAGAMMDSSTFIGSPAPFGPAPFGLVQFPAGNPQPMPPPPAHQQHPSHHPHPQPHMPQPHMSHPHMSQSHMSQSHMSQPSHHPGLHIQGMPNGAMRHHSPPSFPQSNAYQPASVIPSKRPRDDVVESPRPNPNLPPSSRSDTPPMHNYGQFAHKSMSQPGQGQPSQFPHLQNGSANATPSPVMHNQMRPGSVPRRVATASPHPFSPGASQFGAGQSSPTPSEHGTPQPNTYVPGLAPGFAPPGFNPSSSPGPHGVPQQMMPPGIGGAQGHGHGPVPMPQQMGQATQGMFPAVGNTPGMNNPGMSQGMMPQAMPPSGAHHSTATMDLRKMNQLHMQRQMQNARQMPPQQMMPTPGPPGMAQGRPRVPQSPQQQQQQQQQQHLQQPQSVPPNGQMSPGQMPSAPAPATPGQVPSGPRPHQQPSGGRIDPAQFMKNLSAFMNSRGLPLDPTPTFAERPVHLVYLFQAVQAHRGYKAATANNMWPQVSANLGFHPSHFPQGPGVMKAVYERNLLRFEEAWVQQRQKSHPNVGLPPGQGQGQVPGQSQGPGQGPGQGLGPAPGPGPASQQPGPPQLPPPPTPPKQAQHAQHGQEAQLSRHAPHAPHALHAPHQPPPPPAPNGFPGPFPPPRQPATPDHSAARRESSGGVGSTPAAAAAASAAARPPASASAPSPSPGMRRPDDPPAAPGHPPEEESDTYRPRALALDPMYSGILEFEASVEDAHRIALWKPDVPPIRYLGNINIHALARSIQSGIIGEVRMALDTLAMITKTPEMFLHLGSCDDLVEVLIDFAEEQVDFLVDNTVEVSDEIQITPYEDQVRACHVEQLGVRDAPRFGSPDHDLDRAVERLVCVLSILRNISFPPPDPRDEVAYDSNLAILADEPVTRFVCTLVRYVGTRNMFLRTHMNTLDFMKDLVTLLSNAATFVRLPGREQALCLLHFLLAFAPTPHPTSTATRHDDDDDDAPLAFVPYDPLLHPYLPAALDALAKLLARDDPNRTYYQTIFAADYELLTRAFALAVSPVPDQTRPNHRDHLPSVIDARKPSVMQGLLLGDVLASLAPGFESGLAHAWLSAESGPARNLLRLIRLLSHMYDDPPRLPPARGGTNPQMRSDPDLFYMISKGMSMLRRLVEKARDPADPRGSIPPGLLPSSEELFASLCVKMGTWTKAGLLTQMMAYARLDD